MAQPNPEMSLRQFFRRYSGFLYAVAWGLPALLVLCVAFSIPEGGGVFPAFCAGVLLVLSCAQAWMEVARVRRGRIVQEARTENSDSGSDVTANPLSVILLYFVLIAVIVVALRAVGFVPASCVVGPLVLRFIYRRSWKWSILIGIAVTAVTTGTFTLLNFPLP